MDSIYQVTIDCVWQIHKCFYKSDLGKLYLLVIMVVKVPSHITILLPILKIVKSLFVIQWWNMLATALVATIAIGFERSRFFSVSALIYESLIKAV